MSRFILLGVAMLTGCAGTPSVPPSGSAPRLTRAEAESLLAHSLMCVDRDGFTLCLPEAQLRRLTLDRFDCAAEEPARWRSELARLTCAVSGTLSRASGREEQLPGPRADFYLLNSDTGPYWETSGFYIERVEG